MVPNNAKKPSVESSQLDLDDKSQLRALAKARKAKNANRPTVQSSHSSQLDDLGYKFLLWEASKKGRSKAEIANRPSVKSQPDDDSTEDTVDYASDETGQMNGVVDHVLEIHVTSPLVPTLDLIDLPGIVAGRLADEPADMMERTRALVEKYLCMPHTLVLAVAPAGERVRNSQAFQLVQQYKLTDRTIGVLTMVDRAIDLSNPRGPFAEVMMRLDGTSGDVVALEPHGYVVVKNRDTRLSESEQLPLERFKAHETAWLKDHLGGYVERGLASSGALAVKVEKMLAHHVRETWVPVTLDRLKMEMRKVSDETRKLGKSPNEIVSELQQNEQVQRATLKQLLGVSVERVVISAESEVVALVRVLQERMETRRREMRGISLLNTPPTSSFMEMVWRDETSELLSEFCGAIVMSAFFRLATLVRKTIMDLQSAPSDRYHTATFRNLYLLTASTMWTKTEALLADKERLVDRLVSVMEYEHEEEYSVDIGSVQVTGDDGKALMRKTAAAVTTMLQAEKREWIVPKALEDDASGDSKPMTKCPAKTHIGHPSMDNRDRGNELVCLAAAVNRHVFAPLVRQLTDTSALGTVTAGYLQTHPSVDESTSHWFHESSFHQRRDLSDMMKRLKAAEAGLGGLL